jgi:hypothetical protein
VKKKDADEYLRNKINFDTFRERVNLMAPQ